MTLGALTLFTGLIWARTALLLKVTTACAITCLGIFFNEASSAPKTANVNTAPNAERRSDLDSSPIVLHPFSVTLTVTYRGIRAGKSNIVLERLDERRWRYESINRARGLARLVFPEDIRQYSEVALESGHLRPLRYVAEDGTRDAKRDIELIFDWSQRQVRGSAEEQPVSIALGDEDAFDPMSVQLALMLDLSRGATPDHYWLADKTQLKRYVYQFEGETTLTVADQSLKTVIWSSRREGSDRVTRVWHAKDFGYIPVRAERNRGDRLEWSMMAESYSIAALDPPNAQVRGKVTPR